MIIRVPKKRATKKNWREGDSQGRKMGRGGVTIVVIRFVDEWFTFSLLPADWLLGWLHVVIFRDAER